MTSGQRVLVVDGLTETEEVLKTVLEPRGLSVDRIRGNHGIVPFNHTPPPTVVVIHEDETWQPPHGKEHWGSAHRVIIGSAKTSCADHNGDGKHYLQKPFQYRELIQIIECLLADRPASPNDR